MTGPENYREAEKLTEQAAAIMDADYGWMASMSAEERIARRNADLAAAQVHATLALAAATAQGMKAVMPFDDAHAWHAAAGTRPPTAREDSYGDEEATP